jgi:membrane-associated protease RseP (regulator of RpoE activity)
MYSMKRIAIAMLFFGAFLLSASLFFPEPGIGILLWAFVIAAFLFFSTYALKLFTRADTYYLFSLLKTQRFTGFIEWISRPKAWDFLADAGIVLGFGAIAVDYLCRGRVKKKRAAIGAFSIAVLFALFFFVFGSFFAPSNEGTALVLVLFSIAFSLGGLMLFSIAALIWQGLDIIAKMVVGRTPCPGVAPIIPGVQMPNVPPAFTPPLYIWIAFVVILVVHEFSHGALIKRARAKIKAVGLLLAGIFPIGAFVEPDEAEIKSKPARQQLRLYAIGPAANIFSMPVFVALFLVAALAIAPLLHSYISGAEKNYAIESVVISKVMDDYEVCGNTVESPAKGEIEEGWLLLQYNGIDLNSLYDFKRALVKSDKNVSMLLKTSNGTLIEKTLERNQYGKIGIQMKINYAGGKEPEQGYVYLATAVSIFSIFFGWLLLLSFAVAVVNFLPIEPFDGGKMAKLLLLPYLGFLKMSREDTEKFIGRVALWVVAGLLLLNAMPLLL